MASAQEIETTISLALKNYSDVFNGLTVGEVIDYLGNSDNKTKVCKILDSLSLNSTELYKRLQNDYKNMGIYAGRDVTITTTDFADDNDVKLLDSNKILAYKNKQKGTEAPTPKTQIESTNSPTISFDAAKSQFDAATEKFNNAREGAINEENIYFEQLLHDISYKKFHLNPEGADGKLNEKEIDYVVKKIGFKDVDYLNVNGGSLLNPNLQKAMEVYLADHNSVTAPNVPNAGGTGQYYGKQ